MDDGIQARIADWISDNFVWIVLAIPAVCLVAVVLSAVLYG